MKLENLGEVQNNFMVKKNWVKEMKGIDIVRRDWSEISKIVGHHVLDLILDMKTDKDNLSVLIYDYLKKLNDDIAAGKFKLSSYLITKVLNKDPS